MWASSGLFADVADDLAHLHAALREAVRQPHDGQLARLDLLGDDARPLHQQVAGLLHVARLEVVHAAETVTASREDGWGDPLDDVSDVAAGNVAAVECVDGRLDCAAMIVPQHHDERGRQHCNSVFERTQNRGIDDVACGANDEHIAQTLVEDDLRRYSRIRTAEKYRAGMLCVLQPSAIFDALRRVLDLPGDETLIAFFERLPRGDRVRCRHGSHCAPATGYRRVGFTTVDTDHTVTAKDDHLPIDADSLLAWFDADGRDLPWRRPGVSAWQILMSEIMLQQTPVIRVTPIWEQWVHRWPVPSAMAASSQAEVLRAWGKLGYPRRALRLHECSRVLAEDHNDEVPRDIETLLALPGIGAYTARAVACFAYGQRVPVVDTNVRRVVARASHGTAEPANPSTVRDLADVEQLLPSNIPRAARYSAALMELGALICTAKKPACALCPLPQCAWIQAGRPAHTGPAKKVQKFAGTDRQVRGKLMSVLRESDGPVERARLDIVWPTDPAQRDRALDSLLTDGLIEQTDSGLFALAGEGSPR